MRRGFRLVAAGLATALVFSACATKDGAPPAKPKVGTWGLDTADMDKTVRPGQDFFDYTLGSWLKTAKIPSDRTCAGIDLEIDDELDEALKELVEGAANENAPQGDVAQKIGDLYASYMDEQRLNELGVQPVRPLLDKVDGVTDRPGLGAAVVSFNGTSSVMDPFPVAVIIDPVNPTRYIPSMWQGGLTLGERDYYLKQDPESVTLRGKFVDHVDKLLRLAGFSDTRRQAEEILALETKLAEVQWPIEESRDVDKTKNMMSRVEMEKLGAGAPLPAMFDALKLPSDIDFMVGMPDVLAKTAALFDSEPLESWKSYFRYQVLRAYGGDLSTPVSDELFDFYGRTVAGQEQRSPRWQRGVSWVSEALGDEVGQRYVADHFTQHTRDEALDLVENIRKAYASRIDGADWMSPDTKKQAQAKLNAMVAKIGYPDKWKSYDSVDINREDLIGNARGLAKWAWKEDLSKLGKPIDRSEWGMTPQTNNAYYSRQLNDIVFPAAILQAPYFDPAADPAANYGAIGATIGHEMSHGFDDQGRKSDSTGALRDWWTPADAERYTKEADRLVGQFDGYEPMPGMHIKGQQTLGENIADLAGLRVAYDAYKLSLGGKEAPVIDGFTGDQRFFLAYGASWRTICRDETLRNQLLTDVHSPAEYRVNGIVRNMDEWYAAFDVKEGDELYLKPEDRVRVW